VSLYARKSSLVHSADLCRGGVKVGVRVSRVSRARVRVRVRVRAATE